jgi:homoserine kinase
MGPGFDVLGLALTLHTDVGIVGVDEPVEGAREADDSHPAQVAFVRAGGTGRVWVKNSIPVGRGMGFSGAVRVGGIVAAEVQRQGSGWSHATSDAVHLGAELEGHADNVAPSLHGGVVIATESMVVNVPVAFDPVFVMWVPEFTTSTDESRGKIGPSIALTDAVFNISRTAMLVTALTTGDTSLLREATRDRIHQDIRFAASPVCRAALESGLEAGALCGWLSGSGPTVALMCDSASAGAVARALPADGHTKELSIDTDGARVL